jgi:WD repeat-containing protein 55
MRTRIMQSINSLTTRKAVNKIHVLDGNLLASGDEQGVVKVWDIRQQKATREYSANDDFISDLCYSADKHTLIATSYIYYTCF